MTKIPHFKSEKEEVVFRGKYSVTEFLDEMNFTCKKCGNCCRWEGYIYVNRGDIERICNFLQIDRDTFRKKYLNPEPHILPNLKLKENSECIFLRGNECSIYEVRPQQCEDFPFIWQVSNLKDRCPGVKEEMNQTG